MNMQSPFEIPDMIHDIMGYLDPKALYRFAFSNKLVYNTLMTHLRFRYTIHDKGYKFRFHNRQLTALSLIDDTKSSAVIIDAPPSFGKTMIGLYRALTLCVKSATFVLIMVPSKTLSTWIKEVSTYFPLEYERRAPEKSTVLVYESSSHKEHTKYIQNELNNSSPLLNRVVLSTMLNRRLNSLLSASEHLIVDEPQVGAWEKRYGTKPTKGTILALTAERDYKFSFRSSRRFPFSFSSLGDNELPVVDYTYAFSDLNAWIDVAKQEILANNKTVIFLAYEGQLKNKTEDWAVFKKWCSDNDRKLLRFVKSTQPIEQLKKHKEKCVMIANSRTATEGINMIGDSMVVVNPLCVRNTRLFQCVSRLVRTNNPYKKVKCCLIETQKLDCRPEMDFRTRLITRSFTEKRHISIADNIDPYIYSHRRTELEKMGINTNKLNLSDIYILGTMKDVAGLNAYLESMRKRGYSSISLKKEILVKCINSFIPL